MNKAYQRINFENAPSTNTPINATNLNKIDKALNDIDDRVVEFGNTKDAMAEATTNAVEATEEAIKATEEAEKATKNAEEAMQAVFDEKYILTARTEFEKSASLTPTAKGNAIIEGMLGDSFQKQLSGKNLACFASETQDVINGITVNKKGNIFDVSGTSTNAYYRTFSFVGIPTGTYTFSTDKLPPSGLGMQLINADGIALTPTISSSSTKLSYTFTVTDSTTLKLSLVIQTVGTTIEKTSFSLQIESGSVATEYEPYCGGTASPNPSYPQEIESVDTVTIKAQNKNLLSYGAWSSQLYSGITYSDNGDGGLKVNGTATGYAYKQVKKTLPKGTYMLSGCPSGGSTTTYNQMATLTNGNLIGFDIGVGKVFTLSEKTTINIYTGRIGTGTTVSNMVFYPMIRKCDDSGNPIGNADYILHAEHTITIPLSEPLRGINDVKDEICVQNGEYGALSENMEKNASDLTWVLSSDGKFYTELNDTLVLTSRHEVRCTHYHYLANGNTSGGCYLTTNKRLFIIDNRFSTVSEFVTWLSENDVKIQYPLAEPTFEPFADQTPFYELMAYDEVTNVSFEGLSENVSPTATIRFPRNEDGALVTTNWCDNKKNEIKMNELTTALLALSQE